MVADMAALPPARSRLTELKSSMVWRNIAGTTYDVGCPSLAIAFNRTTCTETGKDAQAKCISRHPFCQVSAKR